MHIRVVAALLSEIIDMEFWVIVNFVNRIREMWGCLGMKGR